MNNWWANMNISVKQAEVFIQMSLAKTFEQRGVAADRSENVDKSNKKKKELQIWPGEAIFCFHWKAGLQLFFRFRYFLNFPQQTCLFLVWIVQDESQIISWKIILNVYSFYYYTKTWNFRQGLCRLQRIKVCFSHRLTHSELSNH